MGRKRISTKVKKPKTKKAPIITDKNETVTPDPVETPEPQEPSVRFDFPPVDETSGGKE